MKKVLFVDDEQKVLHGLKRMLRSQRHEWEMSFAESGQAALDLIEAGPVDVIVSDMRMPGMDGATLLGLVQERHPEIVRIVLSGHADQEAAMRALPVTHQFLSKPCESRMIVSVITRACNLMKLLDNDKLKSTIGKIDTLPVVPRIYQELSLALADPETPLEAVAKIIEQDVGISAKILQIVNSSFFGLASQVTSIDHASSYLGINMIRNLVLAMEVFSDFKANGTLDEEWIENEQRHASLAAQIARELLHDSDQRADAFLAAMLHDLGKLILASAMPSSLEHALSKASETGKLLHEVEQDMNGISHAEIGAYLLGLWGMPYPIVEAVANHHHPQRVQQEGLGVLGAVHIADALAHDQLGQLHCAQLDEVYLESIGVSDRIEGWRELGASLVAV